MAIAASYQTVASVTTTAGTVYTTPSTTASYAYGRDMVVTNSGTVAIFVGVGVSNVATSVASFQIPAGATLLLTQGAVAQAVPVTAIAGAGTGSVSIGFASVVSVI